MKAELLRVKGDILTVKLHDELDIQTLANNKYGNRSYIYIDPWIKGTTTDEQRKHYWALVGDIVSYTGENQGIVNLRMKALYMIHKDTDKEPSTARNKMKKEDVAEWLQLIIEYCIDKQIPFRRLDGYVPADISKYLFKLTMNRMCVVCGKSHSDIAHFDGTVGMGRDRRSIDHTQSKFLSLCREHHQEQHAIGEQSFLNKYQLVPLKLSQDNLKELGVM